VLFLSIDDNILELIPDDFGGSGPIPFEKSDFIQGTVFNNDTIDDVIGDPLANTLPLFQLRYFENVAATPFGSPTGAVGIGTLARFRVRVVGRRASTIQIDEVSKTGSEMGYFVLDKPGILHAFERITTLRTSPASIQERITELTTDGDTAIDITLLRLGLPVPNVEVTVARSVSGRPLRFEPSGETDLLGFVTIDVEDDATGYYTVRAETPDGSRLGEWPSIPVNKGYVHRLTFNVSP
jgi:hypothetical protein